jgi:hypothetical protein
MNEIEYAKFIVTDTVKQLSQALAIYAVALTAYWTFVG